MERLSFANAGDRQRLSRIVEALKVPEALTKSFVTPEAEALRPEFLSSSHSALSIIQSAVSGTWDVPDKADSKELVRELISAFATFACGDEDSTASWTTRELGLLAVSAMDSVALNLYPSQGTAAKAKEQLVLDHLQDILRVIHENLSHGTKEGAMEIAYGNVSHDPSYDIVFAYQMTWVLKQIGHPHLGQRCHIVMPCVLTALDHHSPRIKKQGLQCAIFLSQNMNPSELRWYKDVLLDAVSQTIAGSEDLWPLVVKTAVCLLICIEGRNPRSAWYRKILTEMLGELERHQDDLKRTKVWLQHVGPLLEAMGLLLVAHFKRLFALLFYWLELPDKDTCIMVLSCFRLIITRTWPRIPHHSNRIGDLLVTKYLKADDSDVRAAILETAISLTQCCGSEVWKKHQDACNSLALLKAIESCGNDPMVE